MKSSPVATSPESTAPGKALNKVLVQSERVREKVDECADELSTVNVALKEQTQQEPLPQVQKALEKSEVVETKVAEASEELLAVNRALEDEVKERHAMEHQLVEITEREETARHAALHDPLTGLPNRALFDDRLEHGLAQARRHDRILAVMFMDLNGFKAINDTHGHDVGDVVLKTVAGRLKEHARSDDTVSRYGGDEFLYLLTEIQNPQDIASIVEKVIKYIQEPFLVNARSAHVTLSINASVGIAIFPQDGTSREALIKSADHAMYLSKRNKSAYSFAPPGMPDQPDAAKPV